MRKFCISLDYYSPRAYNFVRSKFLNNLPHKSTIRSWYQNSNVDSGPGISKYVLSLLKKKSGELATTQRKLVCSLSFDEINIRKHIQWHDNSDKMLGSINDSADVCNAVLVFMVYGINSDFKAPVAYYYITSLTTELKKNMVTDVIEAVSDTGVIISNITSDGLTTNISVFEKLGTNIGEFKPSFKNPFGNNDIHIIQDPCHMLKLVRNALADREILYDSENNKIEWKYFTKLHAIGQNTKFMQVHKMTKRHTQWAERIMHVATAAETLSSHNANALQFLVDAKIPGFTSAAATINFCHIFNDAFDIMNSFQVDRKIGYKCALNPENQNIIFEKLGEIQDYILSLKVRKSKENSQIVSVLDSDRKTAFRGFLINIISIKEIYLEYVVKQQWSSHFATYAVSQDHLEILFSKIRLLNGCNDNPTQQQFSAAIRKLLFQSELDIASKANIQEREPTSDAICSDILRVSSRSQLDSAEEAIEYEETAPHQPGKNTWGDLLNEAGLTFIAHKLEQRLLTCGQIYCLGCKTMLENNVKVDSKKCLSDRQPTEGTYKICVATENVLKTIIGESNIKKKVIAKVLPLFDTQTLYTTEFDTEHNTDHIYFIMNFIIDGFIRTAQNGFAKEKTLNLQKSFLRQNTRKNVHFSGQ